MTLRSGIDLSELNPGIRPQDDLFRHVNGNWIERTEIPDDKARWGAFAVLAERAEEQVREIIEQSQAADPGSEARKIGDLYVSFMDVDTVERLGAAPIAEQLERVDAVSGIDELLRLVGELEREGVSGFFGAYIEPDPGDPSRYVPFVVQGGLSLPDESYYREESFAEIRAEFRAHAERLLALVGAADAGEQAERLLTLEHALAAHHWNNVDSRDAVKTYNLKSWGELRALVGVDLDPWRDAVAGEYTEAFAEAVVAQPSFAEALGGLLVAERLDEWKAWLRLRIAHAAAPYLSQAIVAENFSFYGTALSGVPQMRERWKRAVSATEGALGEPIGREYVARHFPPAAKEAMDELVANLIEAYRRSIATLEWMSADTRERALEKLSKFTPKIGYPEVWRDYSGLRIDVGDLVGNMRRASVFLHDRELAKVGRPIDRSEWYMTPQTVNAYYNPLMNEIVFPAAILQPPFFDPDRDPAANYGGIGAVIGHEIGHGFDDQGSRFDGDGALRDWWTDADREAFEARTASLIAQYDALEPLPGHHVNGALTIGENIGDLGGLGIAIKAYELSLGGAEPAVIDGLTGLQRVFLSWAQVWQQKGRDAETIRLLAIDPHSPNEFRCNQIVRNIGSFYESFALAPGDALWLDPEERVTIW